jgi:hypothetical protein
VDNTQGVGRCVFLDFGSVDLDQDLDRSALLKALPRLEFYAHTSTAELQDRLKDVEVVLTNSVPFSGDLLPYRH